MTSSCPLCGGPGTLWLGGPERQLDRCTACGFAWMRQGVKQTDGGQSIYEDAAPLFLDDAQADYYRDETAVTAARDKLAWVRAFAPRGGTLLDVGANVGLFAREAQAHFTVTGLEPSPAVVAWARRETGAPLELGSIYDSHGRFDGRFDVVTLFDVIEHVPDPEEALRQCRRFLKPGGHLFLTTPDLGSGMARVLGRHWYYIDMDEHIALFNRANLRGALERCGFEIRETRTIGRRYRFSYIRRRLGQLGRASAAIRLVRLALWPLVLWPRAQLPINLGDVMGVVARRR